MNRHPANNGRVLLSAWVDPAIRDMAREVARADGVQLSDLVAEAVRRYVAQSSADRACALTSRGVAGDRCEGGSNCGRTGCPECQQ